VTDEYGNTLIEIFVPKREAVARSWIGVHIEELRKLYASLNNVRVIRSWRIM
jgi:hypothetical protein